MTGTTVAWVTQPASGPYRLHFASLQGACLEDVMIAFGEVTTGSRTAGLIDGDHALIVDELYFTRAGVSILHRQSLSPVGEGLRNIDVGAGHALSFVVGHARAAVLVTGDIPAFIGF